MNKLLNQQPPKLFKDDNLTVGKKNGVINKLDKRDRAFHDWYRFVQSFPPHLVREYIQKFDLSDQHIILDPFCGTGTTIVEARKQGIPGVGIEANPFAHFSSSVKVDWDIDPEKLISYSREAAKQAVDKLETDGINDEETFFGDIENLPLRRLEKNKYDMLIKNSISPLPLHKTLLLLECLDAHVKTPFYNIELLALAKCLVFSTSNLRFGPEIGVGKVKVDVPVISTWLEEIDRIAVDLTSVAGKHHQRTDIYLADARSMRNLIPHNSIDAVITSPPYPNEKDYTRTTRLESVILGFFNNKKQIQHYKKTFVRSNSRGVYKDDTDSRWIEDNINIQKLAKKIEARRIKLGKTSGFEKKYYQVTLEYFGGMARHLSELKTLLKPGARLAYVVGDQASYLRVMIRTGQLLAEIADSLGYKIEHIELFRTRFATATREELREEIVVFKWPGN